MSTLMERGLNLLIRALPATAGAKIDYQRGEDRVSVSAGFGRTEFQVEDSGGMRLVHSDRDFLIATAELILGGQRAIPQRGDRITLVDPLGRFGDVFEVLAPAGADMYSEDATGTLLRIHAKKLA